jgi:glycerol kinase
MEHRQYYPQSGFVEHDPMEIFANTVSLLNKILTDNNLNYSDLAGIAITNQRETAMVWDRNTGKPVNNAAVWQCQRGAELCSKLKEQGFEEMIRSKTGLIIDP